MSYEVLDRDDFERNSIKYGYPDELRKTVSATEYEILGLVRERSFPFDQTATAHFKFETSKLK
jgi:protein associated with RNAse G/E